MKTKLKIMLVLLVMALIIAVATNVKAEYSAKVTMAPDKTEVKPGDTVTVVVNLVNVVDAGTGASDMGGNVEYDTNFIESISSTQGTWDSANGKFLLSGNILTGDGQFAVLQFKISKNATGSSTIKFTNIQTANGSGAEPYSPDITLRFTVLESEGPGENDNTTGNNNTIGDDNTTSDDNTVGNNNTIGGGNSTTNSIKGNVVTQTKLPNAGLGTGVFIIAIILVGVTIGSYVLYRKYQKI